jgi:general secretion pathway protein D
MRKTAAALFVVLFVGGCANDPLTQARQSYQEGRPEEALKILEKQTREVPEDHAARQEYYRVRDLMLARWLAQAEALRNASEPDVAEQLYKRIQVYDPTSARARQGLADLEADKRHRALIASAEKLLKDDRPREAQDTLRPVLVENPRNRDAQRLQRTIDDRLARPAMVPVRLKPASPKPISLELRDVTLRSLFDILQRATGVSFVFDKDVRADQRTNIAVKDQDLEEVVRLILLTNQLEQKVMGETTVLIYPNTPQKQREYQDLVVKSFYVANADVKQTANMIRTLVKTRDIYIDEKLNMIVLKDTPNAIRLAEKLIATHDLAEPEVVLEVEVLELGYNRLRTIGVRFPDSLAVSLVGGGTEQPAPGGGTAITGGTPGVLSLPEWLNRSSNLVRLTFTDPLFVFSLHQDDGTTSLLANPHIRVRNKETAKVHIGDRVPVITTTAAATGGFVSESVSYLDVGLKLEVQPLVYLDDEVAIKVGLEVSNITRTIQSTNSSTLTYQIGTRNVSTVLRLRDGETQVLAGLISDEDRRTANRVPGIGEFPTIGRLFSQNTDSINKTEIILLITPRLVRTLARPGANAVEFAAGTESATGLSAPGGASAIAQPPFQPPAAQPQPVMPPLFPEQPVPPPAPAPAPPAVEMVPFGGQRPAQ